MVNNSIFGSQLPLSGVGSINVNTEFALVDNVNVYNIKKFRKIGFESQTHLSTAYLFESNMNKLNKMMRHSSLLFLNTVKKINDNIAKEEFLGVADNIKELATLFVKENPEICGAIVKPTIGTGVRITSLPINTLFILNIFKEMPVKEAFDSVKKNPLKGCKELVLSEGLSFGIIFGTKPIFEHQIVALGADNKLASKLAYVPATIVSTLITAPIDTIRAQKQMGVETSKFGKELYAGLTPALLKGVCNWGVGMAVADQLNHHMGESDNIAAQLTAKSVGWLVGNFVGSPFFNMQMLMRKNPELKSMRGVIKHLDIDFSVDKIKNVTKFWKGFGSATPLIILSGSAIAIGEKIGKNAIDSVKNS